MGYTIAAEDIGLNGYHHSKRDPLDRIVDMQEAMRTADDPVPYRVWPLAVDGCVTLVNGRRGEHKSFLAQFACYGVHHDMPIEPFGRVQGPALYIDAENGKRRVARRWRQTGMGSDAYVYVDGVGLRLPADVGQIRALVAHCGAKLVVLDSLRRLAPDMKENESDSAAPVIATLAELAQSVQCAVIVLHHRSVKIGAPNSRGSSALEDQADVVWQLEKVKGDPNGRHRRRLRCTKMRDEEELPPLWVRFVAKDGWLTVEEAEPFESEHDPDSDGAPHVPAYKLLAQRIDTVAAPGPVDGWWSSAALAKHMGTDAEGSVFRTALRCLVDFGAWEATGSTRNRRYRRKPGSIRFVSVTPLGGGSNETNSGAGPDPAVTPEDLARAERIIAEYGETEDDS